MTTNPFYNEILTEHNVRPEFKHDLPDADRFVAAVSSLRERMGYGE